MAARFPLLSFPGGVPEELLKHMHIGTLINLSRISTTAFNLVRSSTLVHNENSIMDVNIASTGVVSVYRGVDQGAYCRFFGNRDSRRFEPTDCGVFHHQFSTKLMQNYNGYADNNIEDVFESIEYYALLFNVSIDTLTIDQCQFHHLKAIQSHPVLRKSKRVHFIGGTVSHNEMRQIMEGFNCEITQVSCSVEPDFNIVEPVFISDFQVINGSWFKGPMLFNLSCHHLMIRNCVLTHEDVNKFIHQWVQGDGICGQPRTMYLNKRSNEEYEPNVYEDNQNRRWNMNKITEGLSYKTAPLPTDYYNFERTVYRPIDNQKLTLIKLENDELGDVLILQSDLDPNNSTICPLEHFNATFFNRIQRFVLDD